MLGPGILYAAMAVGVSHLVQSTRAGAVYGLAMATFIVVIVIVKYPGLCFGAQYTAATGKSLPENYLEQGWWAAALYLGSTLFGMWFALAAITLTTAGLVLSVAGLQMDALPVSGGLLAVTAALLIAGRYQWLESLSKLLVLLLALLVIVATALALPRVTWQAERFVLSEFDAAAALFVVAMVGWMPTPMEGALLTSVWTRSRQEDRGLNVSAQASRFDFNVGYVVALVLALGFLVLGVAVMYEPGINPENSPGGFTSQVIRLFTETMGGWAFYIIGACALAAMFTTLLAAMDGFPRQFVYVLQHVRRKDTPGWVYPVLIAVYGAGAYAVMATLMTSFTQLINFATSLGFVTAPIFAVLNHRAMFSGEVPAEYAPGSVLKIWSFAGIVLLTVASLAYFYFLLLYA